MPSFLISFASTSPYNVISDEINVIIEENEGEVNPEPSCSDELDVDGGADGAYVKRLDVQETIIMEEKGPRILRTLLFGLPSPSSILLTAVTLLINLALLAMCADLTYRAKIFYPAHDLSFARVGYVSDTTAIILTREPRVSQLPVTAYYRYMDPPYGPDGEGKDTSWKTAGSLNDLSESTDFTGTFHLSDLHPNTRYQWVVTPNHSGHFITAPPPGSVSPRPEHQDKYTFLHSSCLLPRFPYDPYAHPLAIPGLSNLSKWIPKLKAQFMLFLGDFIYIDVPRRHGTDVETYRREYRQVYASPDWPAATMDLPWIHVYDDHEIANDWDKNTTGVYKAAADPWHLYHTSVNPPPRRPGDTWFEFTQGPASFFLMDTRKYRDPADSAHPHSPRKSMLGERQLADLLAFLRRKEGVRWKIVISSIPFTKNWRFGTSDTWGGYLSERMRILRAMWDVGASSSTGVIILSGDRHEFAATSFPPPPYSNYPASAAVTEFSTSPLSMLYLPIRTYKQEDEEDVCLRYIPDGNSKFGAVEISTPVTSEQSHLRYRLFVDGEEVWSYTLTKPM